MNKAEKTLSPPSPNRDERVEMLAFQIWEEAGKPQGRSEEHWYLACEMIDAEDAMGQPLPAWLNKQEQESKPETQPIVHELKKKSAA